MNTDKHHQPAPSAHPVIADGLALRAPAAPIEGVRLPGEGLHARSNSRSASVSATSDTSHSRRSATSINARPSLSRMAAYAITVLLSGCASMLQPIPGMQMVATCKSGPAYHANGELICDTPDNFPFVSRKLEPNDNGRSACVFCEAWARYR